MRNTNRQPLKEKGKDRKIVFSTRISPALNERIKNVRNAAKEQNLELEISPEIERAIEKYLSKAEAALASISTNTNH